MQHGELGAQIIHEAALEASTLSRSRLEALEAQAAELVAAMIAEREHLNRVLDLALDMAKILEQHGNANNLERWTPAPDAC